MFDNPRAVLDAWQQGVNDRNVEALISLYDDGAILLPTFSSRTMRTPEAVKQYFVQLGARNGLHVGLHERTLRIQEMGDRIACLSGIYRWEFEVDEEPLSFEARFTFTVDLARGAPIIHHHSSQVPRDLS
ncbi:MAG: DUF4440 domain-containing protein [Proteobacteria bacterium]|nr:DUF4440 domain-containing protein [Pseudomonadota bacterium]MDA1302631.1 DUF4440 domain-containing protein [Pseudomonadota bacterium]